MACYVDPLINYGWKLGPSCHLFADSVLELVNFAVGKIGMAPRWIQKSRLGLYHFDLVESRRRKAVSLGAIELHISDAGDKMREILDAQKKGKSCWTCGYKSSTGHVLVGGCNWHQAHGKHVGPKPFPVSPENLTACIVDKGCGHHTTEKWEAK